MIDAAVPNDRNAATKEKDKIARYQPLAAQVQEMHLGKVSRQLEFNFSKVSSTVGFFFYKVIVE